MALWEEYVTKKSKCSLSVEATFWDDDSILKGMKLVENNKIAMEELVWHLISHFVMG